MKSRSVFCLFHSRPLHEYPELPTIDRRSLTPWTSRWQMADGRKVWVRAMFGPGRMPELVDAREWIETLHDEERWPQGTVFEMVVECQP